MKAGALLRDAVFDGDDFGHWGAAGEIQDTFRFRLLNRLGKDETVFALEVDRQFGVVAVRNRSSLPPQLPFKLARSSPNRRMGLAPAMRAPVPRKRYLVLSDAVFRRRCPCVLEADSPTESGARCPDFLGNLGAGRAYRLT